MLGQPEGAPATEQAEHARMRRLLGPAFSARRMEGLRPAVEALVSGLLDELGRRPPPADLHEALSLPLPALVICQLLGVPAEDREDFRRWSDDVADMADPARSRAGMAGLYRYMRRLIERKRGRPSDDVVSDLLAAQRDDSTLTNHYVAAQCARLLFAGHEATVAVIDRGALLLLTHDAQREALARDPALVPRAVEEILRHPDPGVAARPHQGGGVPRYAAADMDCEGAAIRAGDMVLLAVQTAGLDERVFPAPEAFDVRRESNPHLMFGHGQRFCLGAPLARLELQAAFGGLLRRVPGMRLAVPPERLRPRSGLLAGGFRELPVTW
jgi:pentalenolactone synthase